jgi:hypothetical protein
MRFLIQKIDNKVVHDFSFTLLESIRYQKWFQNDPKAVSVKYVNCKANDGVWFFSPFHEHYVPVGSVEFVTSWFKRFYDNTLTPINIPDELNEPFYTKRPVINGNHMDIEDLLHGKWFAKSATKFKGFAEMLTIDDNHSWGIPAGHYQISEYIEIESEWRAFVYQSKLVGLHNYSGDYTMFPDIRTILHMVHNYKDAPVAYTLDVGVKPTLEVDGSFFNETFIIEVHDFFSCGLYGFADHKKLPYMFQRWHNEYLKKLTK